MYYSIKDTLRASVEAASGGKNTVMYDDKGEPSIMVCIPKFNIEDVISDGGTGTHPAFLYHGRVLPEIWIGKYQMNIVNGRACSLPHVDPTISVNWDQTEAACKNKGRGWHQISRAEWAAIALWSNKNGTVPRGNNNYGKDISAAYEHGVEASQDSGRTGHVLTGSGPATWSHDHTPDGIYDLNGNVWEWNSGMKIIGGKIYIAGEDGTAMNNFDISDTNGGTTGFIDTGNYYSAEKVQTAAATANSDCGFSSLAAASGVTPHAALKSLGLLPSTDVTTDDRFWANFDGERLPLAGAHWAAQLFAGVFYLYLANLRSDANWNIGGRVAYASI